MLNAVIAGCRKAGAEIMGFYGTDAGVTYKEDRSPLTAADQASHRVLVRALANLTPHIPVISEEDVHLETRAPDGPFWLVDPLDGTKEFLKRSGDFTVNVALIENRRPVLGVVYVPTRELIYYAGSGNGAWKAEQGGPPVRIHACPAPPNRLRVVASKDHAGPQVAELLQNLPAHELTSIGSSLKFCLVGEGRADLYPRFVPTMEWDTAAAQCIVEEAGGKVATLDGETLGYGKEGWKNPAIVTIGDPSIPWHDFVSGLNAAPTNASKS